MADPALQRPALLLCSVDWSVAGTQCNMGKPQACVMVASCLESVSLLLHHSMVLQSSVLLTGSAVRWFSGCFEDATGPHPTPSNSWTFITHIGSDC